MSFKLKLEETKDLIRKSKRSPAHNAWTIAKKWLRDHPHSRYEIMASYGTKHCSAVAFVAKDVMLCMATHGITYEDAEKIVFARWAAKRLEGK